jgi:hypothetical protein
MNERVSRALRHDPRAWFGVAVVVLIVTLAALAPLVSHGDPLAIDLVNQLQGPSRQHWLGTDIQGRDVWARLVYGSRVSRAPSALEACTYSSCRTTSTWPRTSRAIAAQPTTPMVKNTTMSDGCSAAAMAMSSSSVGNASVTSARRITTSSTQPPL